MLIMSVKEHRPQTRRKLLQITSLTKELIYKEHLKHNNKKADNPIKNGQNLNRHFTKDNIQMVYMIKYTGKDAQYHVIRKMQITKIVCYYTSIGIVKIQTGTTFAATWMDLEIIIISEVSQTVSHQHHTLPLTCGI